MPSLDLSRRALLKAAAAVPALVVPVAVAEAAPPRSGAFRHGVASGDPLATSVVLWTRVTPTQDAVPGSGRGPAVRVVWELAADRAFTRVLRSGSLVTSAAADHTVKVDVRGLQPYTQYFYRFRALGSTSPVGRTQTAGDDGRLHALRLALVSCSNYTGGWFTPYRYVARRTDLDLVLHLGDYLYEYGNGDDRYGPDSLRGRRDHVPAVEPTTLAQYRARHGHYKTDPDLQAAHAAHPWIVVFDDHEVANDSWAEGAENHQAGEGRYGSRRAAAFRAYVEWMPIRMPSSRSTRFWRRFSFGPLADLSVVETRSSRSQQVAGVAGALVGLDGTQLNDPARRIMEPAQMSWLTQGLRDGRRRWHLVGNQTVFARVAAPRDLPGRDRLLAAGIPVQAGVFNTDQWDGYGDDQLEVLRAMAGSASDTVLLTGDIHSSWANDLPLDAGSYVPGVTPSAGVEVVCPSVTSDGFAEILGGPETAAVATGALQATNPHIRYLDGAGHGYTVLDVTPERVQADFWFVSDREDPRATQRLAASWATRHGSRTMAPAPAPIGRRSDRPATPRR